MSKQDGSKSRLTRRGFLKATTTVAGASVLGLSASTAGQALAEGYTQSAKTDESEQTYSCSCMWTCSNCQYDVVVRDGLIRKACPKPDWVAHGGSRMCLRGMTQFQRIYQPNRIKYPMKRKSWSIDEPHPELRGQEDWERISWDEATTLIAEKWKKDQEQYGKQSVAVHHASGNTGLLNGVIGGLMPRLSNIMGMADLDTCADAALNHGLYRVFGQGTAPENEVTDLANAKTIIVWGANLTSYINPWQWVADARERGARLIVIDPVYSGTAAKADQWIAPRPGSDIVTLMGMMNYMVQEDLVNKDFLLNHTVAPVLINPDTNEYLRMSDLGVQPTEGSTDPLTGLPTLVDPPVVWDDSTGTIVPLDEALEPALSGERTIGNKRARTAYDYLVDELSNYPMETVCELTELPEETIVDLARTSADVPVFHYVFFGTQAYPNGVHLGHAFATLAALTGNVGMSGASLRAAGSYFSFDFAQVMPTGEMVTYVPILEFGNIVQSGEYAGKPFPVKSLYVYSANPLGGVPDEGKFRDEALSGLDLVVVAETQYTDTAKYADIILPAAHWYETADVQVLSISWPGIRITEKAVEPPFECKPDGQIARLLADKLGLGEYFQMSDEEFLQAAVDNSVMAQSNGITYERLLEEKSVRLDVENPMIAVPDLKFNTPTGRVEFYCEHPVPRMDYGQEYDVDYERLPRFFPPYEAWPGTEAEQKWPLILMSERHTGRWHTSANCSWISELYPEPTLRMNPEDAKARGIVRNDYVEATNSRGYAVARVVIDPAVRPGVVMYPKNWLKLEHKDGAWSEMCSAEFDPVGVNSNFMDNRCEVAKWNGGEQE